MKKWDMDIGLYVVLGVVLLWSCVIGGAIAGTVDTFQFGPEVWAEAGYLRTSWVWQAALALFVPGALVYSGIYYFRVRPRLTAAQRATAQTDPAYPEWVARRRWYDRLPRARRSPYEWDKAARRWWMSIPASLISVAVAVFYLHQATRRGGYDSPAFASGCALWTGCGVRRVWVCGGQASRRPEREARVPLFDLNLDPRWLQAPDLLLPRLDSNQ